MSGGAIKKYQVGSVCSTRVEHNLMKTWKRAGYSLVAEYLARKCKALSLIPKKSNDKSTMKEVREQAVGRVEGDHIIDHPIGAL